MRAAGSIGPLRMPDHGDKRSELLPEYLSIGDRYSAQANFDSENTIGGRFRVNRAYKRNAAFLPTVMKQQQWQIGDSLLNSEFGWPPDALSNLGRNSWDDLFESQRLTRRCGSVKEDGDVDRAY